jgi:hypothetical protein
VRRHDVAPGVVGFGYVDAHDLAVKVAESRAAHARCCESAAHSSWDSRLTLQRSATFSAVSPIEM